VASFIPTTWWFGGPPLAHPTPTKRHSSTNQNHMFDWLEAQIEIVLSVLTGTEPNLD
jgi:hypothetical protein